MAAVFEENGATGEDNTTVNVHATRGTPIRYLPLDHLYSTTSSCRVAASGSSNIMSKKVKARKLTLAHFADHHRKTTSSPPTSSSLPPKPPLLFVYSRCRKRRADSDADRRLLKKRKIGSTELERLGVDLNAAIGDADGPRLRECWSQFGNSGVAGNVKRGSLENLPKLLPESRAVKKWVGVCLDLKE